MRLTSALTLTHELGQSARRLGAGVYEYWNSRDFWRQVGQSITDYISYHYRLAMDMEQFWYAEGGFLISMPKTQVGSITECTSITTGRIWPRDLR